MTIREKTASSSDQRGTERGNAHGPGSASRQGAGPSSNSYQVALGNRDAKQSSGERRIASDASDASQDYESITERTARIEHKIIVAQLLLEQLSPLDPRARLLASAVLRRDEVLLNGILSQMTDAIAALAQRPAPAKKT